MQVSSDLFIIFAHHGCSSASVFFATTIMNRLSAIQPSIDTMRSFRPFFLLHFPSRTYSASSSRSQDAGSKSGFYLPRIPFKPLAFSASCLQT